MIRILQPEIAVTVPVLITPWHNNGVWVESLDGHSGTPAIRGGVTPTHESAHLPPQIVEAVRAAVDWSDK